MYNPAYISGFKGHITNIERTKWPGDENRDDDNSAENIILGVDCVGHCVGKACLLSSNIPTGHRGLVFDSTAASLTDPVSSNWHTHSCFHL